MGLSERIGRIKPSPTLAVSARAKAMKAQGIDVVSFGAGEPDFDTPDNIKEAAMQAIRDGFTKYTPASGIDALKEAVCEKFKRDNSLSFDKSQVVISCGGKHAFYNLAQVLLNPGDEVIIPAPYWVSYPDMVRLAGGTPVIVPATEENGFKLTPSQLDAALTDKTKLVVINSPSNPTGAGYNKEELNAIAEVILRYPNTRVISDEIYEKIIYDGFSFTSIANCGDDIREKTLIIHGVSKTYAMTGWRIGFTAGDADIIKAVSMLQSQSTSNPTSIAQKAALAALNGPQDAVAEMVRAFHERREFTVSRLNSMEAVTCMIPSGAFYAFPNLNSYIGKSYGDTRINDGYDLAAYLLNEVEVAAVPGDAFGAKGYLRLSFATSMEEINKGLNRIEEGLGKLQL
jgi:aspartate aminotransferase